MKFILVIVLALVIVATNASFFHRECKCKAVSDTVHFPFHSWELSSCRTCTCSDPSMGNCEASCKSMVENYAKTGCGKLPKGTKLKYLFEASSCNSGYGTGIFTCA